jgi:hypothetical protein
MKLEMFIGSGDLIIPTPTIENPPQSFLIKQPTFLKIPPFVFLNNMRKNSSIFRRWVKVGKILPTDVVYHSENSLISSKSLLMPEQCVTYKFDLEDKQYVLTCYIWKERMTVNNLDMIMRVRF